MTAKPELIAQLGLFCYKRFSAFAGENMRKILSTVGAAILNEDRKVIVGIGQIVESCSTGTINH